MKRHVAMFLLLVALAPPSFALVLPIPIDLPPGLDLLVGKFLGFLGLGGGGLPVSDSGTHATQTAIVGSTAATVVQAQNIVQEAKRIYDLAYRMSQMIRGGPAPPLLRQWLRAIAEDQFGVNAGWLMTANTGMPGYRTSVYPRPPNFQALIAKLPVSAQAKATLAWGMGELLDGVNERALMHIGGIRLQNPQDYLIIQNLIGQNFSPDDSYHGTQQTLDRIGIATTANMQDQQDIKQLLGSLVEMQILHNQQQRNALAVAQENALRRAIDGPVFTDERFEGISTAIQNFRW